MERGGQRLDDGNRGEGIGSMARAHRGELQAGGSRGGSCACGASPCGRRRTGRDELARRGCWGVEGVVRQQWGTREGSDEVTGVDQNLAAPSGTFRFMS